MYCDGQSGHAELWGWGVCLGVHHWDCEVRGVRDFRGQHGSRGGFGSGVIGPMGD